MQLTLVDQFEKTDKRRAIFLAAIEKQIGNFKYFRTLSRFNGMPEKTAIVLNNILNHLAQLATLIDTSKPTGYYTDQTKDRVLLNVTESTDHEVIREYYHNGYIRLRGIFMANKDLTKDHRPHIRSIILHCENLITL